jgi:hypothetical protein
MCKSCGSNRQKKFTGEIAIHFPGLKGIEKPIVWVFPDVLVCLNCGSAEFAVPEAELRVLVTDEAEQRKESPCGDTDVDSSETSGIMKLSPD